MDYTVLVRKAIDKAVEQTDDGIYRVQDTNDLCRTRDTDKRIAEDKRIARAYGRGPKPGESVHMLKDEYGKPHPILFNSQRDHDAFHHLDPLRQGVFRAPDGSFVVRPVKQIVDVDSRQRPRVVQAEHGPVPYMFGTLSPDANSPVTQWQRRWLQDGLVV